MKKTFEDRVQARIQQAQKRYIDMKAIRIAEQLGSGDGESGRYSRWARFEFKDEHLHIKFICGDIVSIDEAGVDIYFDNRLVFQTKGGKTRSYIPGAWERNLNALYQKVLQVEKDKEQEKLRAQQERLKNQQHIEASKWGF